MRISVRFESRWEEDDRVLIKHYRVDKDYSARRLLDEFPDRGWTRGSLDYIIRRIDETGDTERKPGSGRPRSVSTPDNIEAVGELVCSQEENPRTHLSIREMILT